MPNANYAIDVEASVHGPLRKPHGLRCYLGVFLIRCGARLIKSRVELEIVASKGETQAPPPELTPACCPFVTCHTPELCDRAPSGCKVNPDQV